MPLYPELFHIGNFTVRSYGPMMSLAMVAALFLAWFLARKRGVFAEQVLDMALYVLLAGLAGARLWEVVFSWDYYGSHLYTIPMLWQGGLSVQGSILGGALAVALYARKHRIPFWEYADMLAPAVVLGQGVGRLGCFLNGCCYGVPTSLPFGVVYPPNTDAFDAFGSTPLVPAVLFEAAWDFMLVGLLIYLLPRKPFNGFVATFYFAVYAVGRIIIEFFRADSLGLWGLKAAQITSLATLLAALVVMYLLKKRSQKPEVRSQKPEVRSQKPEVRSQKPEVRSQKKKRK